MVEIEILESTKINAIESLWSISDAEIPLEKRTISKYFWKNWN